MQDEAKTKEQLITELQELRNRITESEKDKEEQKRHEEARREAEEQLKFILDKVPALIWQKNHEGKYLLVNKAYCDTQGLSAENVIGKTDYDIFPAEIADQYVSGDRKILSSGTSLFDKEERHQKPSGELGWSRTHKMAYHDIDGDIVGTIGFALDITKRKKAEAVLRESEERFRQLAENMKQVFWISDVDNTEILYVSAAYEEIWGRTCASLYASPKSWIDCVHPEDLSPVTDNLAKRGSGPHSSEYRIVRPDGSIRWILDRGVPILDETGKVYRFAGIAEDITERKRAEDALRESEERYRQVVENVNEAIVVAQEGKLKFANRAALEIFGYPAGELLSRPFVDFIHRDDRDMVMDRHFRRLRGEALTARYPFRLMGKDRGTRCVQIGAALIEWEGRAATLNILTDITERQRAEEEKEKLEAQLLQAQKLEAIGTLAGGIAHDFNNMLQPIIGYTEMELSKLSPHDPMREGLERVLNSSLRAKELVRQILAVSRSSHDEQKTSVDISSIIKEALKLLRSSLPTSIEIRQDIQMGVALADSTQIYQVLMNLCTNASHAMDDKGILEVCLSPVDLSERDLADQSIIDLRPGPHLKLSVSDTGAGMDAQIMERIFDPYFTTKEVGKGSGLGLSVVHGIVKRLDGAITVKSEPGRGTTFSVYIPRVETAAAIPVETPHEVPTGTERILLLDDEQAIVEMGTAILEQVGYKVTTETDSLRALEVFRAGPAEFDLIITDYTMPNLTGMDFAEEVRRIRPDIPIVLCTGFNEKITPDGVKDLGVHLLMKPYGLRQISEVVRNNLDARKWG
jgi:PAS domain S-box-containing protein